MRTRFRNCDSTPPLTPGGLARRVVVVDFCFHTGINWLRTLPYVRAWAERYADDGLVVIGAHTPEFSFEHDVENVTEMLAAMRVEFPIALDNRYALWDAFANHYWPALYFIGADGRIRHHHFGEGDYERSEQVIQELLREAGASDVGPDLVSVDGVGTAGRMWRRGLHQRRLADEIRPLPPTSPAGITTNNDSSLRVFSSPISPPATILESAF
jgi:hypothetical protein